METVEQIGACDGDARARALVEIESRVKTLRVQAGLYPDAHIDCALVRETIALLSSFLPVSAEQDKRAQVDMATEHHASATARSIFALIKTVCGRGGEVVVCAGDPLNPKCGYDARVTWPNGSAHGRSERASSGMYERGADHTADPIEALARLAARVVL